MIRFRVLLALAMLGLPSVMPAAAQPVPEGIHRPGQGHPNLCDASAETVAALQAQLAARLPGLAGNERFVAYEDPQHMRVWTFTTAAHPAHPAVACRTVTEVNGSVQLGLQLYCHSTRENCDSLYREFEELNERVRRDLERAAGNASPTS